MIVDSGNLSNTPDKLAIIAPLMAKMHYDALGIGVYDRRLGEQYLQQVAKNKLTVLDTAPEAPKGVEPFVVKNINGVKVGIVSFGAPPIDADPADDYAMRKARFAAYMQARAKADVLILLDQADVADPDWIQRNGARIGAPDIVIGGASKSGPLVVGKTQIMPTSVEGKTVGVVDIEMADGRDPKLSARSVVLDDKIKADEAVAKQVSDFSIATTHPGTVASAHPGPAPAPAQGTQGTQGTPYYSPALCKACHINEYEDWRKSRACQRHCDYCGGEEPHAGVPVVSLRDVPAAAACDRAERQRRWCGMRDLPHELAAARDGAPERGREGAGK